MKRKAARREATTGAEAAGAKVTRSDESTTDSKTRRSGSRSRKSGHNSRLSAVRTAHLAPDPDLLSKFELLKNLG